MSFIVSIFRTFLHGFSIKRTQKRRAGTRLFCHFDLQISMIIKKYIDQECLPKSLNWRCYSCGSSKEYGSKNERNLGISIVNNLTEIIVFTLPYFNLSRIHPGFFFTQPIPCTSRLNVCAHTFIIADFGRGWNRAGKFFIGPGVYGQRRKKGE